MTLKPIIATLLLAAAMFPARAQQLSLDSCIHLALQKNKEIKAAHATYEKYQFKNKELHGYGLPKISLVGMDMLSTFKGRLTMNISDPIAQNLSMSLQESFPLLFPDSHRAIIEQFLSDRLKDYNPQIGYKAKNIFLGALTLEQPIYAGGRITTAGKMGRIGQEMARLGVDLSREEVIVQVCESYQLLGKAKELHTVALKYDSLMDHLLHDVECAVESGMRASNELLTVKVKKNDARLKVHQAESGIRLAKMNLCHLVGLPLDSEIDIIIEDDDMELPVVLDGSVKNRTEYAILEMKTELARGQVRLEQAELMPQAGMILQGAAVHGFDVMSQNMLDGQPFVNAMLVVKVPIYSGGQTRNKVQAAKRDLLIQQLEQQDLEEKMNLQLQQESGLVQDACLELDMRKSNFEQCKENMRMAEKSYLSGMVPLSTLFEAQLMWQQAYAELAESEYRLKAQIVKWKKAAGLLQY